MRSSSTLLPILIVLAGILLMDMMGVLIRILAERYPTQQLAIFRNLFGLIPIFVLLGLMARRQGRPISLRLRQWPLAMLRGVLVTFAQLMFYLSLTKLEFATVSTLAFSSPMIVTALSVPVLGERVGAWRWGAVLLGFAGVLLVMQPGTDAFTVAALLPVGAACGYASVQVMARLFDGDASTPVVNFYATITAAAGATAITLITAEPVMVGDWHDGGLLLLMGLAGGVGGLCLTAAYRMATPSILAPFEYTGIVFAFLLGWVFFAEAPFERLFPGVLLIIGAGLLIVWRESRVRTPTPPRPQGRP